jgi:hypothetical protein
MIITNLFFKDGHQTDKTVVHIIQKLGITYRFIIV